MKGTGVDAFSIFTLSASLLFCGERSEVCVNFKFPAGNQSFVCQFRLVIKKKHASRSSLDVQSQTLAYYPFVLCFVKENFNRCEKLCIG